MGHNVGGRELVDGARGRTDRSVLTAFAVGGHNYIFYCADGVRSRRPPTGYCYGLRSYGLHSYGLHSYSLRSYGPI